MDNLEVEVEIDIAETSDDELLRRKECKISLFNTIENLSNKIKDILEQTSFRLQKEINNYKFNTKV